MSRRNVSLVTLLSCIVIASTASAQESGLHVLVLAPPGASVQTVRFAIDDEVRLVELDEHGRGAAMFSRASRGPARLSFKIERAEHRFEGRQWSTSIALNGSGHMNYQLLENGRGQASQWPFVKWLSVASRLDVALNSSTVGSTSVEKGVAPDRAHKAEWRNGGKIVCTHEFTLSFNLERSFTCDAATGKVTED
jgi:hypothetical protein